MLKAGAVFSARFRVTEVLTIIMTALSILGFLNGYLGCWLGISPNIAGNIFNVHYCNVIIIVNFSIQFKVFDRLLKIWA